MQSLSLGLRIAAFSLATIVATSAAADQLHMVRFDPDGPLDVGFGDEGAVTMAVPGTTSSYLSDVYQGSAGKFAVAGTAWVDGVISFLAARFNDDGTPDTTFSQDGFATVSFTGKQARAIAVVERSGKVTVAGYVVSGAGAFSIALVRFNADGSLDPSFGVGGIAELSFSGWGATPSDLLLMPSGKTVVVGTVRDPKGGTRFAIARLNTNGTYDTTFSGDGRLHLGFAGGSEAEARSVALRLGKTENDGWIAIGGYATVNSTRQLAVALVTPGGADYTRFNAGGRKTFGFPDGFKVLNYAAMTVDSRGRIVMATTLYQNLGADRLGVARLIETGALDPAFDTDGYAMPALRGISNERVMSVSATGLGDIAIGGRASVWVAGNVTGPLPFVARLDPDGSLAETFNPGEYAGTSWSAALPDGASINGGIFINGTQILLVGLD